MYDVATYSLNRRFAKRLHFTFDCDKQIAKIAVYYNIFNT